MPPPVVGVEGRRLLVFVASAADRWEENVSSFREMTQNLLANQLDPASLPLVLQYNKRDLPEVTPIPFMDRTLNARKVQAISAVAIRGEGVLETFADILTATMQDLVTRYQILEVGKGQSLPQWVKQTMLGTTPLRPSQPRPRPHRVGVAGSLRLSRRRLRQPPAPENRRRAATDRRTVRISLPEDAVRLAGPSARANEIPGRRPGSPLSATWPRCVKKGSARRRSTRAGGARVED